MSKTVYEPHKLLILASYRTRKRMNLLILCSYEGNLDLIFNLFQLFRNSLVFYGSLLQYSCFCPSGEVRPLRISPFSMSQIYESKTINSIASPLCYQKPTKCFSYFSFRLRIHTLRTLLSPKRTLLTFKKTKTNMVGHCFHQSERS